MLKRELVSGFEFRVPGSGFSAEGGPDKNRHAYGINGRQAGSGSRGIAASLNRGFVEMPEDGVQDVITYICGAPIAMDVGGYELLGITGCSASLLVIPFHFCLITAIARWAIERAHAAG